MNILQLSKYYHPRFGGIELVAKMMSKAIVDGNHAVTIISFGKEDKEYQGPFGEKVIQIKENFFFASTPINFSLIHKIQEIVSDNKIERIYSHLPNPFMHEISKRIKRKDKSIFISGVYHSDIVNQKILGPIYDIYFKKNISIYDEMICSSQLLADSSSILSSIPQKQLKIIPFCIEEGNGFVHRDNFQGNLISIGRLVKYKGYETLINAINGTKYKLKIIGNGPLLNQLQSMADSNIEILTSIDHKTKQEMLKEADLYLLPSMNRSEAYGLVMVEAFETGLPVVASRINSGVSFLAKDNVRGYQFTPGDADELRSCVEKIANDPQKYSDMSRNCRDFFDQELTYARFRENLLETIRS